MMNEAANIIVILAHGLAWITDDRQRGEAAEDEDGLMSDISILVIVIC